MKTNTTWLTSGLFAVLTMLLGLSRAYAWFLPNSFGAFLSGYEEVPPVFTGASGIVELQISSDRTSIQYTLSYAGLSSAVTQAHIHFGERPVNGGIIVFLCDNTGKAPAGVPACPNSGTVTGTLAAADVNPPNDPEPVTSQGIAAGDFAGLLGAIDHSDAYANVHTNNFPAGEIRGWLR
jgi:CHRD domain-containing protein